jgi:hypothetical protein
MRLKLVGFRLEDEYGVVTTIDKVPHKSEMGELENKGYKKLYVVDEDAMCSIGGATNFVVAPYKPFVNLRNDVAGLVSVMEDDGKSYSEILESLYSEYTLSKSLKDELPNLVAYLMDEE